MLLICLLALLFVNLGSRGLNEPDEGRYTNIANEMREGVHGWWEPRMSDFAHYDKPPLVYWITRGSFGIFGENEWAARIPCVLGALLTLTGLGWTAYRLAGERVAWWAVLFCGTMGQFWLLARFLTPDMLLTGFCTVGIAFWAEERHRDGRGAWWWAGVLAWSLAWWTKATAALVPLLGLSIGLWATRDRAGRRALRPLRLFALILILGAPWYLSLMHQHPGLRSFFFGRELAGRIAGHPDGRRGPVYYHLALSLIEWAPWWPMALGLLAMRHRDWWPRFREPGRRSLPVEAWLVVTGLTLFSLISSKLPTYTLPFAPWAALLCARLLPVQAGQFTPGISSRPLLATAAGFCVVLVAATFVVPCFESSLGLNSSLREVARFLRSKQAGCVYLDRYAAGFEFYFGEHVFYVTDNPPRQRRNDSGICPELGESHFVEVSSFSAHLRRHSSEDAWLVRYQGRDTSPLMAPLRQTPPLESTRIGDFVLDHWAGVSPIQ
jgi:4-amino-4-deoxy-L-arabinose transferase-like glycosyltransferase